MFKRYYCGRNDYYNDVKMAKKKDVLNGTWEVRFDFIEKKCSFYYNGKFVVVFNDDIPNKFYPAISCYGTHEFECTKFELYYKKH